MSSPDKNQGKNANRNLVDSDQLNPMKEDRSKQKVDKNTKMATEDSKNKAMDRHSRMGKGRGEPKKGGGGGKGTWGKAGEVYEDGDGALDENDE